MPGMVVIGGGQGAGQAAASFRQAGYGGEVILLSEEPFLPYQRPPLSKQYLSGKLAIERVYIRAEKFYTDKNIDVRTNTSVESINPGAKTVVTRAGDVVAYEKLMIATGSRPRVLNVPGNDLQGIHYLRTIKDADAIRAATFGDAARAQNIVIVGGGYIGLEVASVMVTAGLNVTVLEMEDRILQRVTTPAMSAFYHKLHTERGLNIVTSARVSGFEGKSRVSKVLCGEVSMDAELVLIGIGIIPNIELAQEAGLDCDDGILVDDHCRTSGQNIYAIGDCTNHPNPILGRRLRLESVPNAMEQARTASANMLGQDKVYAAVPWFWSDQYEVKLQMAGFSADGATQIVRGDKSANKFAVFYLDGDKLVAVDAVNSPREFMICKQLYGKSVDAEKLADADIDLKTLCV